MMLSVHAFSLYHFISRSLRKSGTDHPVRRGVKQPTMAVNLPIITAAVCALSQTGLITHRYEDRLTSSSATRRAQNQPGRMADPTQIA
jgi:hypothetical protein